MTTIYFFFFPGMTEVVPVAGPAVVSSSWPMTKNRRRGRG